jgi:hypothetical protein
MSVSHRGQQSNLDEATTETNTPVTPSEKMGNKKILVRVTAPFLTAEPFHSQARVRAAAQPPGAK